MTFYQLGGHYVAYTCLPSETTDTSDTSSVAEDGSLRSQLPDSRTATFENSLQGKTKASQRRWCYISDTIVQLTSLEEVLKAKAYLCMYERIYS